MDKEIAELINKKGGTAYYVGGYVRDKLLGTPSTDIDIEVHNLEQSDLEEILSKYGEVNLVGKSFGVYKLGDLDISLPRTETKTGDGHKAFDIKVNPYLGVVNAMRRRDFTINAIYQNVLSGEIIDHFNSINDLTNRIIRIVDEDTFKDDSLRVLRACQFAARLGFNIELETTKLCSEIDLSDLPAERIWGELEKILLSKDPPSGFIYLLLLGVGYKLFPEIISLSNVQQDPIWHPEGDVLIHTLMVIDQARKLIDDLPYPEQVTVMLAALCHDFGKPATTEFIDGRWRAKSHEEAGVEPTERFLDRLNIQTIDGFDVRNQVLLIVKNHLAPPTFYKGKSSDSAFRRLAAKGVRMDLLNIVSRADVLGRYKNSKPAFTTEAHDWFDDKINNLQIKNKSLDNILMGRHLIEMGLKPSKEFGVILDAVYQLQLDGIVTNIDEAIIEAKKLI